LNKLLEPLSNELAQEALDAFAYHGDKAAAARALGLARETLRDRVRLAEARGLKTKWLDMPSLGGLVQVTNTSSVGRKHMVIPDGQVKKGVPLEHWSWIGQYMLAKRPHVVIIIGDFADMPACRSTTRVRRASRAARTTTTSSPRARLRLC
jgi:hypothetical protein